MVLQRPSTRGDNTPKRSALSQSGAIDPIRCGGSAEDIVELRPIPAAMTGFTNRLPTDPESESLQQRLDLLASATA